MTQRKRNRTRTKKATSNAQVSSLAKAVKQLTVTKKSRPFRETGGIIGNRLGGMFGNASVGRGIGRWLGTGIGSIFGSGDYTLAGNSPSYNVMMNGSQIPKFDSTRQTNVVCHREYLGDIPGTAAFTNRQYPLNPGMAVTFPWLSTVASNYQEYKFHGIVFEFRSLITDFVTSGAPGVVVMSTNYNSDAPVYTTKQQMENAEFAVSTKPTINLMHGVECDDKQTILPQRYVRDSAPPTGQDLRLYDLGNFQFATSSNPVQNLGELWVSYCVELFKPSQADSSSLPGNGRHIVRTGAAAATPLGTTAVSSTGNLAVTADAAGVNITQAPPGVVYKIDFYWAGSAALVTIPAFALNGNTTTVLRLQNGGASTVVMPSGAVSSATLGATIFIKSVASIAADLGIALPTAGGVFPGSNTLDIYVTQIDPAAV
uniref:Capsid protein n=1 Tax=Riboviria sp. TaxID=2585031 RepID=A0A514D1B7_9VIRU|nr:MAG: hypothetical protein H3Bulk42153_000002 [Riboviria sp.]